MYQLIRKNWNRARLIIFTGFIITSLLLVTVVYKSNEKVVKTTESAQTSFETPDLKTLKEFLLDQIKSPFINLNYVIKKGDTIQKILKNYKIGNSDIQNVINEYRKFGKPNQLFAGNIINIVIKENLSCATIDTTTQTGQFELDKYS